MFVPRNKAEQMIPTMGLKMLFIHTPKCGGSAVGRAFGSRFRHCVSVKHPYLKGHLTWVEYHDRLSEIGQPISGFVTFSVVRNPFEWHVSWFNYLRRQEPNQTGYEIEHHLFQKFSFTDYVSWLDDDSAPRTPRHDMGRQMSDWTCNAKGEIAVDMVLRQENLDSDLAALRTRYGLKMYINQERVNVFSKGEDFRNFYSEKDKAVIYERHLRDLELFNYSF